MKWLKRLFCKNHVWNMIAKFKDESLCVCLYCKVYKYENANHIRYTSSEIEAEVFREGINENMRSYLALEEQRVSYEKISKELDGLNARSRERAARLQSVHDNSQQDLLWAALITDEANRRRPDNYIQPEPESKCEPEYSYDDVCKPTEFSYGESSYSSSSDSSNSHDCGGGYSGGCY